MKNAFSILSVLSLCGALYAAPGQGDGKVIRDERMGTQVHFQQGPAFNPRNWDLDKTMPLLEQSGLTWLRNAIYWSDVERKKGVYSIPEESLRWINRANEAGLKVSITFNGGNKLYKDNFDPQAYAKAAAFVAGELKGKIGAMEILNEPYHAFYRGYYGYKSFNGVEPDGTIGGWVRKYVDLINTAAPAIKAANPDIKVTGLGNPPPVNFRQLEMGIVEQVDAITDHPYSYRLVPELVPWAAQETILKRDGVATADERGTFRSQIRMYREQSAKFNGPKEIWLTEWGWPTYIEDKAGNIYAGYTESAQAKYILRRFIESIGLGVEKTFQYDFRDDGLNPHDAEQNFGMIRNDYTPKPSYYATQRLAAVLDNAEPQEVYQMEFFPVLPRRDTHPMTWDGSRLAAPGSICVYQFVDAEGGVKTFFWSAERANEELTAQLADVEISPALPDGTEISCYDIYADTAKTYTVKNRGGRSVLEKVTVPDSPVYMKLPKASR